MNEQPLNFPAMGFLRFKDVIRFYPVSKSVWYKGIREGRFPRPVKLSAGTTAWRVEDIRELIESTGR